MTSHIHAIVSSNGQNGVQEITRDLKKHISKELTKSIVEYLESRREWLLNKLSCSKKDKPRSKLQGMKRWVSPCRSDIQRNVEQKLNYIHNNPVSEEIVFEPEQYKYSSALDYAGEKGELEISLLA